MNKVYVNDIEVEVAPQENLIEAAARAGEEVPHYCWHKDLSVVASCRMCLVEVGERKPDGTTVMQPRLTPACQTLARPNTVVVTNSAKVKAAREQTLEYLLLNIHLTAPFVIRPANVICRITPISSGGRQVVSMNQRPRRTTNIILATRSSYSPTAV